MPLEFTFLDKNRNRTTRMAMVSGENSMLNFDLPFEAKWAFVNVPRQLLNLARADREGVIKTTGNQPFAPAKLDLKVNTLPDWPSFAWNIISRGPTRRARPTRKTTD